MILKLNNEWPWPATSNGQNPARGAVALLPPHRTYVEVCGGAAMMAKNVGVVEVFNDLHGYAYNYFRVLRDPVQRQELLDAVDPATASIPPGVASSRYHATLQPRRNGAAVLLCLPPELRP